MIGRPPVRRAGLALVLAGTVLAAQLALQIAPAEGASPPAVSTGAASEVTPTGARLEGTVNPEGQQVTSCLIEYGTSSAYGQSAPCTPEPGSASSPVTVTASVDGLTPASTYHYRLVAENSFGSTAGEDETFHTPAAPPQIGALTPAQPTRVTATVGWTLNPENSPTSYEVLYGTTSAYGLHSELGSATGYANQQLAVGLGGLTPETTYHYQLRATNEAGTVTSPDETFTTGPATPPTAATGEASSVTLTSATVSGVIDPDGLPTSYELDFGTTSEYGTSVYGEVGEGSERVTLSVALQNLAPSTTYHYRIVAINSDGRVAGEDRTFTTPVYSNPIVLPSSLPLIATPAIAFPAEEPSSVPVTTSAPTKHKARKRVRKKHRRHAAHRKTKRGAGTRRKKK